MDCIKQRRKATVELNKATALLLAQIRKANELLKTEEASDTKGLGTKELGTEIGSLEGFFGGNLPFARI